MSIANLAQDGRLIVKQRVEGFEAITGVETRNRYEVLTPEGQSVMLAYEESGGLGRVFFKRNRALTLHIAGLDGQDILGRGAASSGCSHGWTFRTAPGDPWAQSAGSSGC